MLEILRYENKRLKEMFISGEVKVGDIVVWSSLAEAKGNGGRPYYELLGEECPGLFHSKLSCSTKPGGRLSLYRVGTVYCNAFGSEVQIRKATEEEKELFVDACLNVLRTHMLQDSTGEILFWGPEKYAKIFWCLVRYNLISQKEVKELNKELSQIHRRELRKIGRTSLLKLAKDTYGD